jgi:hypothetical protein
MSNDDRGIEKIKVSIIAISAFLLGELFKGGAR